MLECVRILIFYEPNTQYLHTCVNREYCSNIYQLSVVYILLTSISLKDNLSNRSEMYAVFL